MRSEFDESDSDEYIRWEKQRKHNNILVDEVNVVPKSETSFSKVVPPQVTL